MHYLTGNERAKPGATLPIRPIVVEAIGRVLEGVSHGFECAYRDAEIEQHEVAVLRSDPFTQPVDEADGTAVPTRGHTGRSEPKAGSTHIEVDWPDDVLVRDGRSAKLQCLAHRSSHADRRPRHRHDRGHLFSDRDVEHPLTFASRRYD